MKNGPRRCQLSSKMMPYGVSKPIGWGSSSVILAGMMTQIIRLLITMIPQQRQKQLKEIPVEYQPGNTQQEIPF